MDRRLIITVALAMTHACAVGAPLGFEKGKNRWAIPLVGAIEDGVPLTPVEINGNGPYLFAVNLDAQSMIDPHLARALGLWETRTDQQKAVDEADDVAIEQFVFADIPRFSLGDLSVSNRRFIVMETGANYNGHPILGVIGRDVISETLVWTLDRDRSMLYVATQGHMSPPPEAGRVDLAVRYGQIFVETKLDDSAAAELRVLFNGPSQIWPDLARKARLQSLGTVGAGKWEAWLASTVRLGDVRAGKLRFVAFRDQRVRRVEYDGVLGAALWSRYRITMNLHQRVMWLAPRPQDAAALAEERLRRWRPMAGGCEQPACMTVAVASSGPVPGSGDAPSTPPEGPFLVLTREAPARDASHEVLLQAVAQNGAPLSAPHIQIALPAGLAEARFALPALHQELARAASFRVLEATPYPPPCNAPSGCVWLQE